MNKKVLLAVPAIVPLAVAGMLAAPGSASSTGQAQLHAKGPVHLTDLKLNMADTASSAAAAALPPTSRAQALVSSNGITSRVKGFTQIQRANPGIYCLTLPNTIRGNTVVPVVSVDINNSDFDARAAVYTGPAAFAGCPGGGVVVITSDSTGSFAFESFSIQVP